MSPCARTQSIFAMCPSVVCFSIPWNWRGHMTCFRKFGIGQITQAGLEIIHELGLTQLLFLESQVCHKKEPKPASGVGEAMWKRTKASQLPASQLPGLQLRLSQLQTPAWLTANH